MSEDHLGKLGFAERLIPMLRASVDAAAIPQPMNPHNGSKRRMGRRGRLVVVAASIALIAGTVVIAASAVGGRGAVEVDGNEALRDPTRVEGELRAQGIDATIVEVPVLSNMQGRWWWIAFDEPSGLTQREFDGLYAQVGEGGSDPSIPIENSTMLELPKVQGHVTLFVGRTVPADEFRVTAYDRINEFSPTGAFYCLGLDPNDPVALGSALEARGYRLIWGLEESNHGRDVSTPPPGTVVTWAWLRGPDIVDLRISPAGPQASAYQAAEGTYPPSHSPPWSPPCS